MQHFPQDLLLLYHCCKMNDHLWRSQSRLQSHHRLFAHRPPASTWAVSVIFWTSGRQTPQFPATLELNIVHIVGTHQLLRLTSIRLFSKITTFSVSRSHLVRRHFRREASTQTESCLEWQQRPGPVTLRSHDGVINVQWNLSDNETSTVNHPWQDSKSQRLDLHLLFTLCKRAATRDLPYFISLFIHLFILDTGEITAQLSPGTSPEQRQTNSSHQ